MTTITVKTKSGAITDFQVEEIVSIDGQPYVRQATETEFRNIVAGLVQRVAALEAIVSQSQIEE